MEIGDRMKEYEAIYSMRAMPNCPIMVRIDGKAFHNFTSNLAKPYDANLMTAMDELTKELISFSGAVLGYTQSDEITLVLAKKSREYELFFNGKVQKLSSVLASFATATFPKYFQNEGKVALFDCRVFSVPTLSEATNCLLWREMDATRNSVQMAARSVYSHKECENKNASQLQEMLFAKGINFNDYPSRFKRGAFFNGFYGMQLGTPLTVHSHEERIKFLFSEYMEFND